MSHDPDPWAERDDHAPSPHQRLATITELLATGIRRLRDDAHGVGHDAAHAPHPDPESGGLEAVAIEALDRPLPVQTPGQREAAR